MDGWMDGWMMDGQMDGWMGGRESLCQCTKAETGEFSKGTSTEGGRGNTTRHSSVVVHVDESAVDDMERAADDMDRAVDGTERLCVAERRAHSVAPRVRFPWSNTASTSP